MREDIWNIGLQGGIGRGIDGMLTGSTIMRRRRWRRRDLEDIADTEEKLAPHHPRPQPIPDQSKRPPEMSP